MEYKRLNKDKGTSLKIKLGKKSITEPISLGISYLSNKPFGTQAYWFTISFFIYEFRIHYLKLWRSK